MADWLEAFVPLRIHVLVRFGRWDDLIAEPLPDDTRPVLHHRGHHPLRPRRRARRQGPTAAGARRAGGVRRGLRPHSGVPLPVQQHRRDILAIAGEMLDGEIAYREGRFDEAFAHLRRAIELDDALPYDEPWGWMQPTRHAYGALLLEQGRVEEAAAGVRRRPRAGPHAEPGRASTPATCGACTATTNACNGWAAPPRRRSSANSWSCCRRAPTCRSWRRAHAGSRSPTPVTEPQPKATRSNQKSTSFASPVIVQTLTGRRR